MFVYNDQPTTFNSIIFPIKYKKKMVREKKSMRRMSKGKEISYYTRWFSTVWMDEVAALYSVFGIRYRARFRNAFSFLSLSLSLTRGIRDSNIFRITISKLFAQIIQIRVLKMFYDHLPSSNYPFFHRSCKTSFTINAPSSHALSE